MSKPESYRAEKMLLRAHATFRERCPFPSCTVGLIREWTINRHGKTGHDKVIYDLIAEYLLMFKNDARKIPFFKSPHYFEVESKSNFLRDIIIDHSESSIQFASCYCPSILDHTNQIKDLMENNYDRESKKLNREWINCMPFIQEIENTLTYCKLKYVKNGAVTDRAKVELSKLRPLLFCLEMNFLIVNLDESENKESHLRHALITQNVATLVNIRKWNISLSFVISGNTISVFRGAFYHSYQMFDFERTFDLENLEDMLALAWRFSRFLAYNSSHRSEIPSIFHYNTQMYDKMKDEEKSAMFYRSRKIDYSKYSGKIQKKKKTMLLDKVVKNLHRLDLGE